MSDTNIYMTIGDLPQADTKTGEELVEVFQGGKSRQMQVGELAKFNSYDVAVSEDTAISTDSQCFIVKNDEVKPVRILLPQNMPEGRARVFTIVIYGSVNEIQWDDRIYWSDKRVPILSKEVTIVTVLWDSIRFHGGVGIGY